MVVIDAAERGVHSAEPSGAIAVIARRGRGQPSLAFNFRGPRRERRGRAKWVTLVGRSLLASSFATISSRAPPPFNCLFDCSKCAREKQTTRSGEENERRQKMPQHFGFLLPHFVSTTRRRPFLSSCSARHSRYVCNEKSWRKKGVLSTLEPRATFTNHSNGRKEAQVSWTQ